VPCLLLFADGGFAVAADASAQPIALTRREGRTAKSLYGRLADWRI
jgi:hypothetical protein